MQNTTLNAIDRYHKIKKLHDNRYSQTYISKIFGISRQRVSQILNTGLPKFFIKKTNIPSGLTQNEYQKQYRIIHKIETNARKIVYSKLRNKTLIKLPCIKCGKKKVEAHHEDYSKPLEVLWLCKKHHIIYDRNRKERINGLS